MRPVNLVPQDQRRRAPSEAGGKLAYGALGVLALLLVMVVAYVFTSNKVTEAENQTATLNAEAEQLEAKAAQQGTYTGFAQLAQTRMQSVASVANGRFDWERFMRELSRVMPEGSWLQAANTNVLGSGEGTDGTLASAAAEPTVPSPTANLVGCTPGQQDVARMMVRLGQLHRVTDVELGESAKEDSGQASIESCGSNYKFDITVTFSPVTPASGEAPLGSPRVPASLGGGS
jgi:Tfp pilus assembly protein PilN